MEDTLQMLQGTVARVIYENSESGYTVFELAAGGELHAVAGTIGEVHEGETVTVYGTFGEHKTYGFQFQAQSCCALCRQGNARRFGRGSPRCRLCR